MYLVENIPPAIVVDDALADSIWYNTAQTIHDLTRWDDRPSPYTGKPWNDLVGGRTGDDPGDDWCGVIDIFHDMFNMRWDEDPKPALTQYINTIITDPFEQEVYIGPPQGLWYYGEACRPHPSYFITALGAYADRPPIFDVIGSPTLFEIDHPKEMFG